MRLTVHREKDHGYSPDVEIDHDGKVKWARDIAEGEVVSIPLHMMSRIARGSPKAD